MKKVLVAEDEASIREFIVINLERAGYTVVQAEDGISPSKLSGRMFTLRAMLRRELEKEGITV